MDSGTASYPPWNFSWVVPGQLAAMAWPQTVENLNYIVTQGIKHLITLSPEKRPPIHECPDLLWTQIPVREFEAPSVAQISKFIDICQRSRIKNECHPVGELQLLSVSSHTIQFNYESEADFCFLHEEEILKRMCYNGCNKPRLSLVLSLINSGAIGRFDLKDSIATFGWYQHFGKDSQAVGVHCRMGRGRTGVMAACYLACFCDQSPERAIINVRLMRPGSLETYEQEKAVISYYDTLRRM